MESYPSELNQESSYFQVSLPTLEINCFVDSFSFPEGVTLVICLLYCLFYYKYSFIMLLSPDIFVV